MEDIEDAGKYIFRLNVYETDLYQHRYRLQDFPLMMNFRQDVYLGVEVITQMPYQYIFTQRCWATPTADPHR